MSQPPMPQGPPTQPAQFPLYPSGPVQPSASTTSPAPPRPKLFGWPTVIITAVVAFSLGGITAVVAGVVDLDQLDHLVRIGWERNRGATDPCPDGEG